MFWLKWTAEFQGMHIHYFCGIVKLSFKSLYKIATASTSGNKSALFPYLPFNILPICSAKLGFSGLELRAHIFHVPCRFLCFFYDFSFISSAHFSIWL
jgi:hypothetical protein